jgi:hypothetical protein
MLRTVALVVVALPVCAMAQTTHDASRIGGSIYPTVIPPAPLPPPAPPVRVHPLATTQNINAVCLTSQAHADHCPAQPNMAFCDVDSVGLSHCLSQYASVLVKQPVGAKRTLSIVVRDANGDLSTTIVLAKATQSDDAVARTMLQHMPGAAIVAMSP